MFLDNIGHLPYQCTWPIHSVFYRSTGCSFTLVSMYWYVSFWLLHVLFVCVFSLSLVIFLPGLCFFFNYHSKLVPLICFWKHGSTFSEIFVHFGSLSELQRDVLTLNFVQVLMLMLVKSTRFPLSQLSLWLQKKAGAVWVEEYDCMVFECKRVWKGTRLYLENSSGTSKDVKMKIYTR